MRSFFEIFSSWPALFPEFSAADPIFFLNCQLATPSFFEILSTMVELFLQMGTRPGMAPPEDVMIIRG
jgi:hypothetical protein